MADLLEKDDTDIVKKIVADFEKAEKAKEPRYAQWQDNYRMFKSILKYINEGKSNVFIPYTWTIIQQLVSKAIQALYTRKPFVGFAPQSEDDVQSAEQMESLVYFQMKDRANLPIKSVEAFLAALIYGTVVGQWKWRTDQKKIKKRQPIVEMGAKVGEEVIDDFVKIYDDPDVDIIPLESIFPDPEGTDIDSCRYMITRFYKDRKYLEEMERQGIYELPDDLTEDGFFYEDSLLDNFRTEVMGLPNLTQEDRKKTHEVISWYTDDYLIEILDRKYVLRKIENPYYAMEKPFVRGIAFLDEQSFWGDSLVRIMSSLQLQLNVIRNQRLDNVSLVLNKIMLTNVSDDSLDDIVNEDGTIDLYPGRVIPVRDVDRSVKWLDVPDITGSSYQEENIVKQDMQYISAVSEQSRGMQAKSRTTATELSLMSNNAEQVFNYFISMIEFTFLLPLGSAFKKLNQQFITAEKTARLFSDETGGYEFKKYDPEGIAGDFDIVSVNPRYEAAGSKEARRQQLLDMFNSFAGNQLTSQYLNIPKFLEEILGAYEIKDYKSLIQIPEQMPTIDPETGQPLDPNVVSQAAAMVDGNMPMAQGQAPMPQEGMQPEQPQVPTDPQSIDQLAEMISQLPPEEQAKAIAEFDKMGAGQ